MDEEGRHRAEEEVTSPAQQVTFHVQTTREMTLEIHREYPETPY